MDNMLMDFVNEGIKIASSSVSSVVGALITTLFLRKNTKATEFEKIKAGKFSDVIDELLNSGKMTYLEYYKCNNFLKIAKIADRKLAKEDFKENEKNQKNYDFDWFVRFYDYASNISNEEMQALWAAILMGEIERPGTTSISLLHALSMMRQDQANFFCNIARFSLMDIKDNIPHLLLFVSTNRDAYKKTGITPTELKELERLGLLECDFKTEYIFWGKKMFRTGNKVITVHGDPNNDHKIKAGNVNFTKDGELLYSIIDKDFTKYRSEILDFIITKFQRRNCYVTINNRRVL